MKKRKEPGVFFILLRYIALLLLAVPNLFLFYFIFTPLTVYPSAFFLSLFYETSLQGNTIIANQIAIRIVEACVAGSAYFLLLLLNLSVPMHPRKRIYSIIFSLSLFYIINIIRIFIFSLLLLNHFKYFDITHKFFWYVLSGVIVFLVWFFTIKPYKIKEIPFYTDIKFLYKLTRNRKR